MRDLQGAEGGTSETTTLPVITGQRALSAPQDWPLTIGLSDLTVSDPDNSYPKGFALWVQGGSNYGRSGNTITPFEKPC